MLASPAFCSAHTAVRARLVYSCFLTFGWVCTWAHRGLRMCQSHTVLAIRSLVRRCDLLCPRHVVFLRLGTCLCGTSESTDLWSRVAADRVVSLPPSIPLPSVSLPVIPLSPVCLRSSALLSLRFQVWSSATDKLSRHTHLL